MRAPRAVKLQPILPEGNLCAILPVYHPCKRGKLVRSPLAEIQNRVADYTVNKLEGGQRLKKELWGHRVEVVHCFVGPSSQRLRKCCKLGSCLGSQLLPKCEDTRFCMQTKIESRHLKERLARRKEAHNSVHVVLSEKSALYFVAFY